ncbi:uncharacterized protein LOC131435357 isoform X3 [Malaya genurostris]|uniref:uncharacterized protein LOC131435357 isoform X3 n=1 Tax=Malaya genurostris TaxID=325434 RepID=UPI0026F3F895|nr:uncharacterized protein LOC131435357 isoform X3 [Malaya genurostris]
MMIRKRQLIALMLLVTTTCSSVASEQTVKAENKASVDSSAILESLLCAVRSNPWLCIRQQAGRMLDNWEDILDAKKREMMEDADKECQQRSLKDDARNSPKVTPSDLINQIEDGLGTISDYVSDGVDGIVSARNQKSNDDQASPKKHLHHILKLGKRKGKKKKTYIKLFMLGAALKGKIELLLKILSFHLQLKFFAIAAIGLLINIGRFWFDLKKQPQPQKVIYYEHAQHQHHYDDHGDDYGGYWKRSLHGIRDEDGSYYSHDRSDRPEDGYPQHRPVHYAPVPNSPSHYPYDPHTMAYHQQRPYA